MADNEVNLEILVEIQGALGRLESFEKESAKSLGGVEKAFGAIKTAAAAAVAFVAGREVIQFFQEGIESAIKQEQALAKLSSQLSQTGEDTDDAVKAFVDLGDELERTTKFEDDAVISAAALAKSFGLTNDEAIGLTKAAAELASVTGDSLEGATKKLAETYSGATGALDKQLPVLKSLTKEQLANGEAIQIVLDRYGGSAQREIQTFSGSIGQTEKAFGNLQEAIAGSIVQSPVVIAAIQAIGAGFGRLQDYVDNNKESFDDFVNGTVKVLAVSVPVAVDILGWLIKGLQTLTIAGGLAFSGLLDVVSTFGRAWQATIGAAHDALFGLVETIVKGAADIPLLSKGFDLIGVSLDDSAAAVGNFRRGYADAIETSLTETEKLRDETARFAADASEKFDSFNEGFSSFSEGISDVTQGIFDADMKVVESGKKVADARREVARATGEDAKAIGKLREESQKFLDALAADGAGEAEKALNKRDQDLAKLREYFASGVVSAQDAANAEVKIREVAQAKVNKILDEDDAKYAASLKERLDKLKTAVNDAAANPLKFVVDFALDPDKLATMEEVVGASLGVLNKVLGGKQGAKDLLTAGASALGDFFIPGIGGAVGSIFSKLTEGPEATKEFIKGFVDGVPDIMTAVAESIPVVVEVLVDSLINKGGAVKIAVAIAKAFAGEAVLKSVGKQIGISIGDAFNGDVIVKKLGDGFDLGSEKLGDFGQDIADAFSDGADLVSKKIGKIGTDVASAFGAGVATFLNEISNLGIEIANGFNEGVEIGFREISRITTESIRETFQLVSRALLIDFPAKVSDLFFVRLPEVLRNGFAAGAQAIGSAFTAGADFLTQEIPRALERGFTAGGQAIDAAFAAAEKLLTQDVPQVLGDAFTAGAQAVEAAFANARRFLAQDIPRALESGFNAGARAIGSAFTSGAKFFSQEVPRAITSAFAAGSRAIDAAFNALNATITKLGSSLSSSLKDFTKGLVESLSGVIAPMKKALSSFQFPPLPSLVEPFWLNRLAISTPPWLQQFADAVNQLTNFGGIGGGGGGGGGGGVLGSFGKALGFAEGGLVPPGFPNDRYPAWLTSGERVLTPRQDDGLMRLLEDIASGRSVAARQSAAPAGPIQVVLQIGERELASVMLDLNRQGYRTA